MFQTFDVILKDPKSDNTKNLMDHIDYGSVSIVSTYRLLTCIDLRSGLTREE